jgi:hypothetical protein
VVDEPESPTGDRPTPDGGDWFESDEEELERMDEDEIETVTEKKATAIGQNITDLPVLEAQTTTAILTEEEADVDVTDAPLADSIAEAPPSHPTVFTGSGTPPLSDPIPIQIVSPPEERRDAGFSAPTDTPRLHPLASPDLPTPSPIGSTSTSAIGWYIGAHSRQGDSRSLTPSMAAVAPFSPAVSGLADTQRLLEDRNESLRDVDATDVTITSAVIDGQAASSRSAFAPQVAGFTSIPRNTTETELMALHGTERIETHAIGSETSEISRYEEQEDEEGEREDDKEEQEEEEEMVKNGIEVDDDGEHEDEIEIGTADGTERTYGAESLRGVLPNAKHMEDEVISIISDEEDVDEEMEDQETENGPVSVHTTQPELEADYLSDGNGGTDEELQDEPNQDEDISEEEDDIDEEERDDMISSESEIEEEYDVVAPQSLLPPRIDHPNVIVLDSDSDDEPRPTAPRRDDRDSVDPDGYDGDLSMRKEDHSYSLPDDSESQGQSAITSDVENEYVDEYESQEAGSVEEDSGMDEDSLVGDDADEYDEDEDRDEAIRAHAIVMESLEAPMLPALGSVDPNLDPSLVAPDGPRDAQQSEGGVMGTVPSAIASPKENVDLVHEAMSPQGNGPHIASRAESGQQLLSPQSTQLDHINQLSAHEIDVATPLMPTPQATQVIETRSELVEAAPPPSNRNMNLPDDIVSVEVLTTPRSPSRRWTDGSNEGRSALNTDIHTPGIDAKEAENTEREPFAPELADEVVLVEDHSTRQSVDTERQSPEAIKSRPEPNRLASGLRSRISYFAPLATLVDWYKATIDNLSVVVEVSPLARATSGSRDYHIGLRVSDVSMAGTTVAVHIFRPHWTALPSVAEGDVILLRNFQVQSFEHSMMLVSCESSAWAIFPRGSDEPRIPGPPVEYGEEELLYVKNLRNWYCDGGAAMVADYLLQTSIDRENRGHSPSSVASSDVSSVDSMARGASAGSRSRRKKSSRRATVHELINGRKYVDVGSPSDKDSIHELRDGTVYAHSFEKE